MCWNAMLFARGYSTSKDNQAPVLQLHLPTMEFECRSPARCGAAPEGQCRVALCCVTGACSAVKSNTGTVEQLWVATAQTMPMPRPVVALDLEAIAAVPNLEEDKMKTQPSLLRAENKERGEEGATLKVWSKKRGGGSW